MLLSTLSTVPSLKRLLITYDIACQYFRNFASRIFAFPPDLQLDLDNLTLDTDIPKFHLPAHGAPCQSEYNLNYEEEAGRTYGEGIEAEWSHINTVATSTRESAPGVRHERLNDHWGFWNHRKTIGFGMC